MKTTRRGFFGVIAGVVGLGVLRPAKADPTVIHSTGLGEFKHVEFSNGFTPVADAVKRSRFAFDKNMGELTYSGQTIRNSDFESANREAAKAGIVIDWGGIKVID